MLLNHLLSKYVGQLDQHVFLRPVVSEGHALGT